MENFLYWKISSKAKHGQLSRQQTCIFVVVVAAAFSSLLVSAVTS